MTSGKELREAKANVVVRNRLIFYGIMIIIFIAIGMLMPKDIESWGLLSGIPALFLIVFIFKTKRIIEALTLSTILGCIMAYHGDFLVEFSTITTNTMMSEDIAWLIIVCGLLGSFVAVLEESGGGYAFGEFVAKRAKTEKSSLLYTALCSAILSIDDYLSALTSGAVMTPINDRKNVPREMTAYVVDTTAAPASVLNPISSWAVFIGALMVTNGVADEGHQVIAYVKTIPYNFYALGAILVMILVILGVIPKFGGMKKAYQRVADGGPLAPPGSEKIDIRQGEGFVVPQNPKLRNFFVPIIALIGSICFFDFDVQMGVLFTIGFNMFWFMTQGMDPERYVELVLKGLKNMLMPILLMVLAFCFADMCDRVGFLQYVIDVATANIPLQFLPIAIFVVFFTTEFIMGINWGMYILALPMVVPITLALGGDPIVSVGVVAAAGVWGSHCCFYSDATILTSASTGCENFRHAITQIPFGFIAGIVAAIGYLILGFVIY